MDVLLVKLVSVRTNGAEAEVIALSTNRICGNPDDVCTPSCVYPTSKAMPENEATLPAYVKPGGVDGSEIATCPTDEPLLDSSRLMYHSTALPI